MVKLFIVTAEFQIYAITYQKWTLTMAFFVEGVQECNSLDGLTKTHLIWKRQTLLCSKYLKNTNAITINKLQQNSAGLNILLNRIQFWQKKKVKTLKSTIFWDITPCSLLKFNRGTYCLHLQDQKSQASYQPLGLPPAFTLVCCSAYSTLKMERYVPPKHWATSNGLHSVISQKTVLLITIAVRTSNPTAENIN
jgi:hypothetical protein